MDFNQIIGENLKRLRTERNLSLTQLSKQCDISKVLLSQIEKGDTNPTINTISKLSKGLKVPYTALLDQVEHETTLVHHSEIQVQEESDSHYRIYCYYPTTPNRNFEFYQLELDAGHQFTSVGHAAKTQEYIMVLEGELTLTENGVTHVIKTQDAISFAATNEHTYKATSNTMLKVALINYYPI